MANSPEVVEATTDEVANLADRYIETRRIRDQIHEETAGMSREERREWYSRRPTDPVLARLFDRRKPPEGGESAIEARQGWVWGA